MSGFASGAFLAGLGVTAGVLVALFVGTWLVALRVGRFNVVDVTWGLAFVAVAAASFAWSAGSGADLARRSLVLALVTVWGVRLAAYIGWRSRGHGEDPRYERMLARARGSRAAYALVQVFLLQAAIAWFVSLPVQAAMYERSAPGGFAVAGGALWLLGLGFEAVGDAQLAAFKRDPGNAGRVLDRGLWRYTRHPNYFGEACLWAGLYLVAAQHWVGALTVLSPVLMTYFVAFKSGKPMLEAQLARTKPGYADYVARTSGFVPRPPKRRP